MHPGEVLTRAAEPPDLVLRYGDHTDQLIDVFLPTAASSHGRSTREPVSLVALLHGGFWRQAYDRVHVRPMANALRAGGLAVAAIEYRRSGGAGGWPATFDDVRTALSTLPVALDSAAPQTISGPMTMVGHSAGGHLAMWAALHCPGVARVVALAPVADLYAAYDRSLGNGAVAALLGGSPQERPAQYAAADVAGALPAPVPVTVIHGDRDGAVPVDMSRRLRGVRLVELSGVEHFALIDPRSDAWAAVSAAVRDDRPVANGDRRGTPD